MKLKKIHFYGCYLYRITCMRSAREHLQAVKPHCSQSPGCTEAFLRDFWRHLLTFAIYCLLSITSRAVTTTSVLTGSVQWRPVCVAFHCQLEAVSTVCANWHSDIDISETSTLLTALTSPVIHQLSSSSLIPSSFLK